MQRRTIPLLIVALICMLPTLATAHASATAPSQPAGWVTLMSQDFEGEFPAPLWHIGRTGDPYLWGQRDCNPNHGRYSMWGGGGGSSGSLIPCSGMYVPSFATTLSYGPFDLSGCSDARLNFAHWSWLGAGDGLGVGFSIDGGTAWHLLNIVGNAVAVCDGYCEETFYQARWDIPLCGQPKVYLLFRFSSNASGVSYGAFVDDVSLEAYYAGPTPSISATPTATRTSTSTATRTATPTATATLSVRQRIYLPQLPR